MLDLMEKKIGISKKKISVILPVYNGELYLDEALESILCQTYANFELIVVDDCSTDHTVEIIRRHMKVDNRIRYIKNVVNKKLPRTLNVGFANAEGDYFTWTSDDNRYKPEALERMVYWLETEADIDMVYADFTGIDADGKVVGERQMDEPFDLVFHNVVGACFLYKKEAAKKVGEYDPSLFLAEDYDYWIRIMRQGRLKHIHENLYYYREHEKSLTISRQVQVISQAYKVMEKHFLYLYSLARERGVRIKFLEALEDRAINQDKRQVRHQLYCVYSGYRWYIFYRGVKYRLGMVISQLKEK